MQVENKVQLITYPDSLGGDLSSMERILDKWFTDLFVGGIHILPPFPSSGDRGFAPLSYMDIDPLFGTWENIEELGRKYPIMLDLIVNHVSSNSHYFQDFLNKGSRSVYSDLFIPIEKIWSSGKPVSNDLETIFLRRDKPFSDYRIGETGEIKTLWTTFGKTTPSKQVDINVDSAVAKELFTNCLSTFSRNNVKFVRLDAVGYVVKKPGTSCFFIEPEIFKFLEWIDQTAKILGIEILPEVHAEYSIQRNLAEKGHWIYDFILPYRILEAFIFQDSKELKQYLLNRPHRQFTMLDCHDGIPVKPDLNGIFDVQQARKLVNLCLERGGNVSKIYSPKHLESDGFNVHQIRGTYYSLLGENDLAYLSSRAIQFFTPGIPQVYYVGLLAGRNDEGRFKETGDGREINRHNYTEKEISSEIQRPVVRKLFRLIQFRNNHPAFNGEFMLGDSSDKEIIISWKNGTDFAELKVDFTDFSRQITYSDGSMKKSLIQ